MSSKNIELSLNEDNLDIHFNGNELPEGLLDKLKENKTRLIEYLRATKDLRLKTYSLAPMQEGLWFDCQFEGASRAYNIHHVVKSIIINLLGNKYNI